MREPVDYATAKPTVAKTSAKRIEVSQVVRSGAA